MIEVIEGKGVGSGKSYFVVDRLVSHWRNGGTAYVSESFCVNWEACKKHVLKRFGLHLEDDQYSSVTAEQINCLHENTPPGTSESPVLIIIDEAQDQLNARDWGDKSKRDLFSWCCQSRHDDNDLLFVSQSAANIDKQIRRLATYTWSVRNARNFSIPGLGNVARNIRIITFGLNDGFYFVRTMLDYDGRTVLDRKWVKADRGLFGCYESKSMRLTRKRSGEAVKKRKLQRAKGRHPMFKYILMAGLIAASIAGWKLMHNGGFHAGDAKPTSAIVGAPTAATATTVAKAAYVVQVEQWRSCEEGKWIRFAETGLVIPGRLCKLGMVEAIRDHEARIRQPDGSLLYLLGQDMSPVQSASTTAAVIVKK
jgi:hypothetical protein